MSIEISNLKEMINRMLERIENLYFDTIKVNSLVRLGDPVFIEGFTDFEFLTTSDAINTVLYNFKEIVNDVENRELFTNALYIIAILRYPQFINSLMICFDNACFEIDFETCKLYLDVEPLPILTINLTYDLIYYIMNKLRQIAWNWVKTFYSNLQK